MSRRGPKPVVLTDYDKTQKLTFTAWVNSHLRKVGERMDDLSQFADGVTLVTFVTQVTGTPVNGGKTTAAPRLRIQIVENLQLALRHVEACGVRVTCDPDNFFLTTAADVRMVLGFLWLLICRYQINAAMDDALTEAANRAAAAAASAPPPASPSRLADRIRKRASTTGSSLAPVPEGQAAAAAAAAAAGGGRPRLNTLDVPRSRDRAVSLSQSMAGTQSLLQWVTTEVAPFSIEITNFGSCFQDGRAFCALVELVVGKESFDYAACDFSDPVRSMSNAFATADMELNIPQLLVPEALVKAPDPHSIMTYVSYFRTSLSQKRKARRAALLSETSATYASAAVVESSADKTPPPPQIDVSAPHGLSEAEVEARVKAAVAANAEVAAAKLKAAEREARAKQLEIMSEKEAMARKIEELTAALRSEQAAHTQSNNEAAQEISSLRTRLTDVEAQVAPLTAAKTELEDAITEAKTREEGFVSSISVVERALAAKTKAAAAADVRIIDLESELESAKDKIEDLSQKHGALAAELSASQSAIHIAKVESEKIKASSKMTEQEAGLRVTELETQVERYRTALVEKNKSRKALKEALIEERKHNLELTQELEAVRTAAEKYKAKLKVSKKLLKAAQEKANSVKAKNRKLGDRLLEVKSKSKAEKRKAHESQIQTIAAREAKVKGAVVGELERQRMELLKKLAQAKYQRSATPTLSPLSSGSRRSSLADPSTLPITPGAGHRERRRSGLAPPDPSSS